MTVFAEIILVVSAAILSYFLLSTRKHNVPELFFHNLAYDPAASRIRLTVENYGTKPLHIKPSFRLIHLKSAEEWKNDIGDDGIPLMAGHEMTLIKGYDLLCESEQAIELKPQDMQELEFDLADDHDLHSHRNIRVSMLCGRNPIKLTDAIHSTMRVKVEDFTPEAPVIDILTPEPAAGGPGQAMTETLQETYLLPEAAAAPDAGELELELIEAIPEIELFEPVLDVVEPASPVLEAEDSKIELIAPEPTPEPPKLSIRQRVFRLGFPVEATCVCCGQIQWLNWVVDKKHVCVGCRDFMYEKISLEYPPEELELDLTARQKKIMGLIEYERQASLRELANLMDKSRATVNKELKVLLEKGAIARRKDKSRYVYKLA